MASKSSSPYLKHLFNRFNRRFWANSLPSETVVRWASKREWRSLLGRKAAPWGVFFYDDDIPTILIDEEIKKRGWKALMLGTLLHECVHLSLKGRDRHGPVFEREMIRLARLGAFKGIW